MGVTRKSDMGFEPAGVNALYGDNSGNEKIVNLSHATGGSGIRRNYLKGNFRWQCSRTSI